MTHIDDVIALLQKVRNEKGNIPMDCSSYCGTHQDFAIFDIQLPDMANFEVDNHVNGHGVFGLSMELSQVTRDAVAEGIENMKRNGKTFYRSQFVEEGKTPEPGLSPCAWHMPW